MISIYFYLSKLSRFDFVLRRQVVEFLFIGRFLSRFQCNISADLTGRWATTLNKVFIPPFPLHLDFISWCSFLFVKQWINLCIEAILCYKHWFLELFRFKDVLRDKQHAILFQDLTPFFYYFWYHLWIVALGKHGSFCISFRLDQYGCTSFRQGKQESGLVSDIVFSFCFSLV